MVTVYHNIKSDLTKSKTLESFDLIMTESCHTSSQDIINSFILEERFKLRTQYVMSNMLKLTFTKF